MNSNIPCSVDDIVDDITRLHGSLPPRPEIDDIEAALALIRAVDKEEKARMEEITGHQQQINSDHDHHQRQIIPEELVAVQGEMQRRLVMFQSREQKKEAVELLELESAHAAFDELVQRAERCFSPGASASAVGSLAVDVSRRRRRKSGDDGGTHYQVDIKGKQPVSDTKHLYSSTGDETQKLNLIKFASLIESSFKNNARDLNVANKLTDQVDWLPASISKLTSLISLNLSENQLAALPTTLGSLLRLSKLDLHSNRIAELPTSIGDLLHLLSLNLRGNQLKSIPPTFSQLTHLQELDISSNRLNALPDAVGSLTSLKKLNIEANNVEEIPHTIGNCTALVELRADYNRLKGLPEAVGRLEQLEVLTVRYNNIKSLPTTMASLRRLKELDVSFNELESVPESLCLATTLVRLNLGNNFADLRALPRAIGNLEMLEELDISNNQIRALPDSFGLLSHLRVLRLEENPLEVPPNNITKMEAQAVVEYMAEFVAKKAIRLQPLKGGKKSCAQFCFFARPNVRSNKRDDYDYRRS